MEYTEGKWMLDKNESRTILIPTKLGMFVYVTPEMDEIELAKANAERITKCVNGWDNLKEGLRIQTDNAHKIIDRLEKSEAQNEKLKEALIISQRRLEQFINSTPTGEFRNNLTNDNIQIELALKS